MKMTEYKFFVYILFNERGQKTYIGVTNNLRRRIFEHKLGLIDGYSKKHNLTKLGYVEEFKYIDKAILREKQLKKWQRPWKYRLIETQNPYWIDMAVDIDEYINTISQTEIEQIRQEYKIIQKEKN